jgi:hypothetical protein
MPVLTHGGSSKMINIYLTAELIFAMDKLDATLCNVDGLNICKIPLVHIPSPSQQYNSNESSFQAVFHASQVLNIHNKECHVLIWCFNNKIKRYCLIKLKDLTFLLSS